MSVRFDSISFRKERETHWRTFEVLVNKIDKRGVGLLTRRELAQLPSLYNNVLGSLAIARESILDAALVQYLESLAARGYLVVYGPNERMRTGLLNILMAGFPRALRGAWPSVLIVTMVLAGGYMMARNAVDQNIYAYYLYMPEELIQGRTPHSSREHLESMIRDGGESGDELVSFSAQLFMNNAMVSGTAFATTMMLALPGFLIILLTGCMMGAFVGLYAAKGLEVGILGWLLPHGITEIFAIVVSAAAGVEVLRGLI